MKRAEEKTPRSGAKNFPSRNLGSVPRACPCMLYLLLNSEDMCEHSEEVLNPRAPNAPSIHSPTLAIVPVSPYTFHSEVKGAGGVSVRASITTTVLSPLTFLSPVSIFTRAIIPVLLYQLYLSFKIQNS